MLRELLRLPPPPLGPAQGAGRGRRVLPFAVIVMGALTVFLASNAGAITWAEAGVLVALPLGLGLGWMLLPWDSLPRAAQLMLPVGTIVLIVLMQALALPGNRDVAVLMLVPVLWTAAYGTAHETVVVVGLAIASVLGMHLAGLALGNELAVTGWTEVVAMSGGLALLGLFTVTARAHARTDALTGAANRRAWDELLARELSRARRHPVPITLGIIDLDQFKRFNDSHGHTAGDRHLAACVSAWRNCLRSHDVLARLGGEEFAVLLVGVDGGAGEVAGRLMRAVPGGESCSIGLAEWDGRESPAALLARADDALYTAKAGGRAGVATAPPTHLVPLMG